MAKAKKQKSMEETLLDSANKLRGTVESSEYKHIVLGLIFLKFVSDTYKLAKMNLAIRGISANLGGVPADTFVKDQHKDLKADFIMANPPLNQKNWRGANELLAASNANYGWILNMVSKLSQNGVAGFILANGALSGGEEKRIRKELLKVFEELGYAID